MLRDARQLPGNWLIDTDLCIIDAGPAGITIASESDRNPKVVDPAVLRLDPDLPPQHLEGRPQPLAGDTAAQRVELADQVVHALAVAGGHGAHRTAPWRRRAARSVSG